jgi:uncharacterized protein YyaL (SSP411 family)
MVAGMNRHLFWKFSVAFGALMIGLVYVLKAQFFSTAESYDPIVLAATYLAQSVKDDGSFIYEYDPANNRVSRSYNILRHSGTIYAMLESYRVTQDPEVLSAAIRAIEYLETTIRPCPEHQNAQCVVEEGSVKLGGNALAVLALVEYQRVTGDATYNPLARKLSEYILQRQKTNGEFSAHKVDVQTGAIDPFVSEYYPGEAIFALARIGEITSESKYTDAAHLGAEWLIRQRDFGKSVDELPHDHWLLYGLHELYVHTPKDLYLAHARLLTDAILKAQNHNLTGSDAQYNGGYFIPARSTPTATRTEGLGAAYKIFVRAGDVMRAQTVLAAMSHGIEFQMRTFISPEVQRQRGYTKRSVGGFCESLEVCRVRIDYVQHNLSALIAHRGAQLGQ